MPKYVYISNNTNAFLRGKVLIIKKLYILQDIQQTTIFPNRMIQKI